MRSDGRKFDSFVVAINRHPSASASGHVEPASSESLTEHREKHPLAGTVRVAAEDARDSPRQLEATANNATGARMRFGHRPAAAEAHTGGPAPH